MTTLSVTQEKDRWRELKKEKKKKKKEVARMSKNQLRLERKLRHKATDAEYCAHLFRARCVNGYVNLLVSESGRNQHWQASTMQPNWR